MNAANPGDVMMDSGSKWGKVSKVLGNKEFYESNIEGGVRVGTKFITSCLNYLNYLTRCAIV